MISASAYILRVPPERRDVILDRAEENRYFRPAVPAEPVPRFDHSRRAPLVVFACFADDRITHVADGRKGASAGTDLVRLNLEHLEPLQRPVPFEQLIRTVPTKFSRHVERILGAGGLLPTKTMGAVVDALIRLDPSLSSRLSRLSERRAQSLSRLSPEARVNLALQKETLGIALEIAGLPKDAVGRFFKSAGIQRY
jgi:predicted transcriptional regulator